MARGGQQGGRKEVPKAAVKKAYAEGILQPDNTLVYPTIIQVAKQFGVARETVSRWVNRESWETDRALYQQRLEEAAEVQKAKLLPNAPGLDQATAELTDELKAQGIRTPISPSTEGEAQANPPDFRTHVIAGERAKFDATSLTLAKALMAEVGTSIVRSRKKPGNPATGSSDATPLLPRDLHSLAGTLERAQRIGRLALGQTTENQGVSSPEGGPLKVDAEHSVDVKNSSYANLTPAELARLYVEALRAGPADGEGQASPGSDAGSPQK